MPNGSETLNRLGLHLFRRFVERSFIFFCPSKFLQLCNLHKRWYVFAGLLPNQLHD